MNIACIGGGPAGLYLGILVKRAAPEHQVVVFERNRPADTFGFGVVFSDATLGHFAEADPETHAQITAKFARWDDIEVHTGGEVLTSTGHGFCGMERKAMLEILQARATRLGVQLRFEHEVRSLDEARALATAALGAPPDLIVGCDGVGSWVRDALADHLRPEVDVRPNKFVWLGCTLPFRAFTFIFKQTAHGLYRVHAYPFTADRSTFIVECREDTWRKAGLDTADEDETLAILTDVFRDDLRGASLIKNRSIWRNFPTVRCQKWSAGSVVLLGDAAHTAHFSIGSGTKLAMEDSIALRDELLARPANIPTALAAYEARRRPEVEALQAAAQASLEWFEGTERYMAMSPLELTYSLMTRSLRVGHRSMMKRDPHLARGMEALLATAAGAEGAPPPPHALPFAIGDRTVGNRTASMAADGRAPGLVLTPPCNPDEILRRADWAERVARIHAAGAKAGLVLATTSMRVTEMISDAPDVVAIAATGSPAAVEAATAGATNGELVAAVAKARELDFDLVILDPVGDVVANELLPSVLIAVRGAWRPGGWLAARVRDMPRTRNAVVGHAAQLVRAGANLLVVESPPDADVRIPSAPMADRLRHELGVATCCVAGPAATDSDVDAAIAAGRADLVLLHSPE